MNTRPRPFPIEKYRFYLAGNKIIAASTYAGKLVRGVAICHPHDKFDLNSGKALAAARCNERIAAKRYARATDRYIEACKARDEAEEYLDKMRKYMNDSYIAMNEAAQECDALVNSLK